MPSALLKISCFCQHNLMLLEAQAKKLYQTLGVSEVEKKKLIGKISLESSTHTNGRLLGKRPFKIT